MCGAELFPAGRGEDENPRGGAKMKIRGAVQGGAGQKSDKSAKIVTGGFILQFGLLIKENITLSDFKWSFCKPDNHKLYKRRNIFFKLFLCFTTLSLNVWA